MFLERKKSASTYNQYEKGCKKHGEELILMCKFAHFIFFLYLCSRIWTQKLYL